MKYEVWSLGPRPLKIASHYIDTNPSIPYWFKMLHLLNGIVCGLFICSVILFFYSYHKQF